MVYREIIQSAPQDKITEFLQNTGLPETAKRNNWFYSSLMSNDGNIYLNAGQLHRSIESNLNNYKNIPIYDKDRVADIIAFLAALEKGNVILGDGTTIKFSDSTKEQREDFASAWGNDAYLYIAKLEGAKYASWLGSDLKSNNTENAKWNAAYLINIFTDLQNTSGEKAFASEIERTTKTLKKLLGD